MPIYGTNGGMTICPVTVEGGLPTCPVTIEGGLPIYRYDTEGGLPICPVTALREGCRYVQLL